MLAGKGRRGTIHVAWGWNTKDPRSYKPRSIKHKKLLKHKHNCQYWVLLPYTQGKWTANYAIELSFEKGVECKAWDPWCSRLTQTVPHLGAVGVGEPGVVAGHDNSGQVHQPRLLVGGSGHNACAASAKARGSTLHELCGRRQYTTRVCGRRQYPSVQRVHQLLLSDILTS